MSKQPYPPFIDYSQYHAYKKCPMYWYEKYVAQWDRPPTAEPSDTKLTLGSLVHAGIEVYERDHIIAIPNDAIQTLNPTPECLNLAESLLHHYTRTYQPISPETLVEQPIRANVDGVPMLAKVDSWFKVDQPTTINTGIDVATLEPGVWAQEHKTKSLSISRANWIGQWETKRQADFQILTLQQMLKTPVRGVVVNVIEYAEPYVPKRTCKHCRVIQEFSSFVPTADGLYRCTLCGEPSKLDATTKAKPRPDPVLFRFVVRRSDDQLQGAINDIYVTRERMLTTAMQPNVYTHGNSEKCVDTIFGRCMYAAPHVQGGLITPMDGFVQVESLRYTGTIV